MKAFQRLAFDFEQCRAEVEELKSWLATKTELKEREDIQPFFEARHHLSAYLGSYNPSIIRFDLLAFQFPLFGDFTCDVAVGDSVKKSFCFIEFEDAGPNSVFVKQGRKVTREWSPRFDHGFSQIVDWFFKLEDLEGTRAFSARFGASAINANGILVVGRDRYFEPGERERLDWRQKNVVVASQKIECVTFDGLADDLLARLEVLSLSTKVRKKKRR